MTASDFEIRNQWWILLALYAAAFACWPLDRRDVAGFLANLLPVTRIGAGVGYLLAAGLVAAAAGITTWSRGRHIATVLGWTGVGLLLNWLGLAILEIGVGLFVYRAYRLEHLGHAPTSRPGGWLAGAHLWVLSAALAALAATMNESLFLVILAGALGLRMFAWHRQGRLGALAAVIAILPIWAQVTTSQYDNARTGATLREKALTPESVRPDRFGKEFSLRVDGAVYAEPLFLPHLDVPGEGRHDVVFVATEHDSVYAFDAEGSPVEPLWRVSFINRAEHITTVPPIDLSCPFIRPEVGITSTPVIDPSTGTLYVVARTKENKQYVQRLHALSVLTGEEKFGGPVSISAAVEGSKQGSENRVLFDSQRENQRAALLLLNQSVFITWASSCDVGPYFGWVMVYDAATLTRKAVLNTAREGGGAGIWQGDAGPAADDDGNIFLVTGNGSFNAIRGGHDYGQSVLKLRFESESLVVTDYFTPFNFSKLNETDADLGSSGPVLLPRQPGRHAHLLVVAGKGEGPIYLLDRDRMGKFQADANGHAVQTVPGAKDCFGAPAYWNQSIYYVCEEDALKAFRIDRGRLLNEPVGQSTHKFSGAGVIPAVSANGSGDGIVWLIETPSHFTSDAPAVLHAFDAADVSHELYNSEQRSRPGWRGAEVFNSYYRRGQGLCRHKR